MGRRERMREERRMVERRRKREERRLSSCFRVLLWNMGRATWQIMREDENNMDGKAMIRIRRRKWMRARKEKDKVDLSK